ncbi:hypothetical protein, partial, partial [Parasitella parasitica]
MADRPVLLSTLGPLMGTTSTRLLRKSQQRSITPLYQLEKGPIGSDHERLPDTVEPMATSFSVPTIEFDQPLPPTSSGVPDLSNDHHSQLAERVVVFDALDDNQASSANNSTINDPPRATRRRSPEESEVGVSSVEHFKRQRLREAGYDSNALAIFFSPEARPSQQQYTPIQQRFVSWCAEHRHDPFTADPTVIVNLLAYGHHNLKWKCCIQICFIS